MKPNKLIPLLSVIALTITSLTFLPATQASHDGVFVSDDGDAPDLDANDDADSHDANDDHGVDPTATPSATASVSPSASPAGTPNNGGHHRGRGRGRGGN